MQNINRADRDSMCFDRGGFVTAASKDGEEFEIKADINYFLRQG